jgi:hypothetical protein
MAGKYIFASEAGSRFPTYIVHQVGGSKAESCDSQFDRRRQVVVMEASVQPGPKPVSGPDKSGSLAPSGAVKTKEPFKGVQIGIAFRIASDMAVWWDLFFSYRRHDLKRAEPLLHALGQAGVRVWRDESDIPDQASITAEIRYAIANSKVLLAFYSRTYPLSNPCQQEITSGWLAAQQTDHTASRRIWIVNPEPSFEHIPELLRDQQSRLITGDTSQLVGTVQAMKEGLDALDATLRWVEVCVTCPRTMA